MQTTIKLRCDILKKIVFVRKEEFQIHVFTYLENFKVSLAEKTDTRTDDKPGACKKVAHLFTTSIQLINY